MYVDLIGQNEMHETSINQSMYYIKLSKRRGSSTTYVKGGSTEPSPASVTQGINIISNRKHPSFDRPGKGSPEKTRRELSIESTMSFRVPCPPQMMGPYVCPLAIKTAMADVMRQLSNSPLRLNGKLSRPLRHEAF